MIVPVYNAQAYLDRCLASIQAQSYKDLEAILVDDGSTDGSLAVCQKYARDDVRFQVVSSKNAGACAARNLGLARAEGEYVSFVDADDAIADDFLSAMCGQMERDGADLCVCDISVNGSPMRSWKKATLHGGKEILKEFYAQNILNRVFNKLYRAELIRGIRFPEGRDLMEDAAFMTQVLHRCKTVSRLDQALYIYTFDPKSLSHRRKKSLSELRGRSLNLLEQAEELERWQHECGDEQTGTRLLETSLANLYDLILEEPKMLSEDVFSRYERLISSCLRDGAAEKLTAREKLLTKNICCGGGTAFHRRCNLDFAFSPSLTIRERVRFLSRKLYYILRRI